MKDRKPVEPRDGGLKVIEHAEEKKKAEKSDSKKEVKDNANNP